MLARAELKPTNTHSWHDSTSDKTVHAIGLSVPINYQEADNSWARIDSRWEQVNDTTWRVVKGNHKAYAFADGRAYYVLPRKGVRHAIGTDTRRLIKFNKSDSTWSTLFTASVDSVTISQGLDELDPSYLTFHDIFPGVDKILMYDRGRYVERYVFHQEARDSLANYGPWANHWMGTATRLDLDSLNLNLHDSFGKFSVGVKGRLIRGWLKCQKSDTMVFTLSREYLWAEDTLVGMSDVIVRKWVVKLAGKPYLVEMFNPVPTASWAEGDIWHRATFGNANEGGSDVNIEDDIVGGLFTPSSSGTVDSIKAYLTYAGSGAAPTRLSIYEWDGPTYDSIYFVDSAAEILPSIGTAWYMALFYLNASITNGQRYSLTVWGDRIPASGADIETALISGDSTLKLDLDYANDWPNRTAMTTTYDNRVVSILCYYTEGEPPEAAGQVIFINK